MCIQWPKPCLKGLGGCWPMAQATWLASVLFSNSREESALIRSKPNLERSAGRVSSLASVCDTCEWTLRHAPVTTCTKRSGLRTVSTAKLLLAAADHCWQCAAILEATIQLWDITTEQLEKMVQFWVRYDAEAFTIRGQRPLPTLQVFTSKGEPQVARLIPAAEIASCADSPNSLNFIKHHLTDCLRNHASCQKYTSRMIQILESGSPKRILRINSKTGQIRLVNFRPPMSGKYTALSYCWGDQSNHVRATSSTLPSLRRGLSISNLPATLRDAIKVSSNIGADLIWIDSMCIVQDDPSDWEMEAAKMSAVYSGALITIIAASAASCDEGFLKGSRRPSVPLGLVQAGNKNVEIRGRILRDWGYHRNAPQGPDHHKDQWLDPIDSRGWVLQERLLSNRYISFTTGEVQWGCQDMDACECGQAIKNYFGASSEDQWHAITQEFTKRHLSFQTDTLTALAGIARKYSTMLDRKYWTWYAAGVWLGSQLTTLTARSLLWYRNSRNAEAYFPKTYLAPTFSWASVVGEITPALPLAEEGIYFPVTVLEVEMDLSTSDQFGQVTGGYVRIQGPLLAAKMTLERPGVGLPDNDAKIDLIDSPHTSVTSTYPDSPLEKAPHPQGGNTVRRRRASNVLESEEARCSIAFDGADVFLLPITADVRNLMKPGSFDRSPKGEALILARSMTRSGYERIAQASYIKSSGDWSQVPVQEFNLY